eukprot:TRINITY_DN347_c0_g1_i1.p1 TRINITY_DN347_c0_g1~~TRINITY_DN347_c0_g1_i1.p1  ORF type:complete len:756 (-),score=175.22 TRINITY_DN347_c0_g1_i1:248-2494(-)
MSNLTPAELLALDAADGVIDGQFHGAEVQDLKHDKDKSNDWELRADGKWYRRDYYSIETKTKTVVQDDLYAQLLEKYNRLLVEFEQRERLIAELRARIQQLEIEHRGCGELRIKLRRLEEEYERWLSERREYETKLAILQREKAQWEIQLQQKDKYIKQLEKQLESQRSQVVTKETIRQHIHTITQEYQSRIAQLERDLNDAERANVTVGVLRQELEGEATIRRQQEEQIRYLQRRLEEMIELLHILETQVSSLKTTTTTTESTPLPIATSEHWYYSVKSHRGLEILQSDIRFHGAEVKIEPYAVHPPLPPVYVDANPFLQPPPVVVQTFSGPPVAAGVTTTGHLKVRVLDGANLPSRARTPYICVRPVMVGPGGVPAGSAGEALTTAVSTSPAPTSPLWDEELILTVLLRQSVSGIVADCALEVQVADNGGDDILGTQLVDISDLQYNTARVIGVPLLEGGVVNLRLKPIDFGLHGFGSGQISAASTHTAFTAPAFVVPQAFEFAPIVAPQIGGNRQVIETTSYSASAAIYALGLRLEEQEAAGRRAVEVAEWNARLQLSQWFYSVLNQYREQAGVRAWQLRISQRGNSRIDEEDLARRLDALYASSYTASASVTQTERVTEYYNVPGYDMAHALDAQDGVIDGKFHGAQIRVTGGGGAFSGTVSESAKEYYRANTSAEAARLDALDGVIDGKHHGVEIQVQPEATVEARGTKARTKSSSGTRSRQTAIQRQISKQQSDFTPTDYID